MAKTGSTRPAPWWIAGGTEVCEHCHQRYHYHQQYRCSDCDGPLCPECVIKVKATGSVYCLNCDPGQQETL